MNDQHKKRSDNKYIAKSITIIILLAVFGGLIIYGTGTQFSRTLYFSFIIVLFFMLKDDVFGVALLFILILNPHGLFYYRPYNWMIRLTSTVGISYTVFFSYAIILKFLILSKNKSKLLKDRITPYAKVFFFYMLFLLAYGAIYGIGVRSIYYTMFGSQVVVFFVLPRRFNYKEMILFNKIIMLYAIIQAITSIIDISTGGMITDFLFMGRRIGIQAVWRDNIIRQLGGNMAILYTLFVSMYYLVNKERAFKKGFLWTVIIFSLFYLINSATRGWFMGISFFMIVCLILYFRETLIKSKAIIIILGFALMMYFFLPGPVRRNLDSALQRLATIEEIVEGDLSAGGTSGRWHTRGPIVLSQVQESPVFGFGFSDQTFDFYDAHVGNHVLLLIGGVLGLIIAWVSVIVIIAALLEFAIKKKAHTSFYVFAIAMISIMIIHSTSRTMISYRMPGSSVYLLAMLFNVINAHLNYYKTKPIVESTIN